MSVEFSGQITTSGAGLCPARTALASAAVAAAWLAVTVVARSWSGRFRECGTLPWIVATTALGPGPGTQTRARLPTSTNGAASAARTRVPTLARTLRPLACDAAWLAAERKGRASAVRIVMAREARPAPDRASRNVR